MPVITTKKAKPKPYVYQEYPRALYNWRTGKSRIVNDPEEAEPLEAKGWKKTPKPADPVVEDATGDDDDDNAFETPPAAPAPAEPVAEVDPVIEAEGTDESP